MYEIEWPENGHDVEGGYLTENCNILVEGVWNGTRYTSLELAKAANKWRDNTVWNRHYEGKQRDETNRIGILKNQHFEYDRIVGDVFLSNSTPEGRDMIALVKDHKIDGISVEHTDIEVNGVATEISFLGLAIVPEPACNICHLSKKELNMEQKDFDKLSDTVKELGKSVKGLSNDKLQDTVADLVDQVKELGKVDVDAIVKEQSRKDAKIIKELGERIKELEDTPQGNGAVATDLVDSYAGLSIDAQGISRRM